MSTLLSFAKALPSLGLLLADVPNPDATQPPGTEGFNTILGWLKWGGLAACVAGIIIAGAMMAIQHRRGEGGESLGKVGWVLVAVIVISAGASLIGFLAD